MNERSNEPPTPAHSRDRVAAQLVRLRRIEGQVRGVQRMLEDGRDYLDVVTQLQAIVAATDRVAARMLEEHIRGLVTDAIREQRGDEVMSELTQVLDQALRRQTGRDRGRPESRVRHRNCADVRTGEEIP